MSNEKVLSKILMQKAFERLDSKLSQKVTLVMGGGGAMIWAHNFPLATTDVDAIPKGIELEDLDRLCKEISMELQLPGDWLNFYFSSFAYVILPDFESNLIPVFQGKNLLVNALSKEDMLIMKCFAHRPKDVAHAKSLLKQNINLNKVENHIELLKSKKLANAEEALEFLDDLLEQMDEG